MKTTEQTIQQIERAIRKTAQKFPFNEDPDMLTDIHVRVSQDSGEMVTFDDDDNEINRCVVEQWIDNKDEDFYAQVTNILRKELRRLHDVVDGMGIMKPFSFVLEDDDKESVAELYLADDDTVILGGDLMENLDKDLNKFFNDLMKDL